MVHDPDVTTVGPLVFPGGILSLRRVLRQNGDSYDVVQVFDAYYALPAAYFSHASPMVMRLGTDPREELRGRYGVVGRTAISAALPVLLRDGHLVVNSAQLSRRFRRYKPRLIPNGVDFRRFEHLQSKAEARREIGVSMDRPLLLFIGKVIPVKRVDWVLEIIRRLGNVRGVIVGGYNEERYGDHYHRGLLRSFSDVFDRVTFTGEVPSGMVGNYLAAADIFVFPSSFEGMPNAVLEAMAAGLPVVASDIPAHQELIRDGTTGFLAGSISSMADLVERLVQDQDLRASVGNRARAFVRERLSFERCAQLYLELYESLKVG